MKRVIGYIRVSTNHQAESGLGLADQESKIRAYCDLYDLELVGIKADEGCSGRSLKGRDALQEVTDAVHAGDVDGVVIAKLDRLTRSVRDLQTILDNLVARTELHSVSEKIDTSSATGRLILNVLTSVASWEAEITGERTSDALKEKQKEAQAQENATAKTEQRKARRVNINGRAPYGYRWEDGELVEVAHEQEALAIITELRSRGITYATIAKELSDRGVTTKRGGQWRSGSVRDILAKHLDQRGLDIDHKRNQPRKPKQPRLSAI
jgi:site-specific DNA recombinase